jgi:hypothetical protein
MDLREKHPEGQAALIMVLIMMVTSTIALSVVQRTIQELDLTTTEESAAKALQAAESGVEQGLRTLTTGETVNLNGANYAVDVSSTGSDGYLSETDIAKGNTIEIPLTGSPSLPTSIDIYWSDTTDVEEDPDAAIEVLKYQQYSATDYRVTTLAYDPDAARRATNNFAIPTTPGGTALGVTFGSRINIPLQAEDRILRVRTVYNRAKIGLVPQPAGTLLPTLQYRIVSTGQTDQGIVRKIEVIRDVPSLPQYLDFALYSGGALTQTNN